MKCIASIILIFSTIILIVLSLYGLSLIVINLSPSKFQKKCESLSGVYLKFYNQNPLCFSKDAIININRDDNDSWN